MSWDCPLKIENPIMQRLIVEHLLDENNRRRGCNPAGHRPPERAVAVLAAPSWPIGSPTPVRRDAARPEQDQPVARPRASHRTLTALQSGTRSTRSPAGVRPAGGRTRLGRCRDSHGAEISPKALSLSGRQIQSVEAFDSTSSVNNSEGLLPIVNLTRSVVDIASHHRQIFPIGADRVPFGKYSRTMRLRFSLLPRSHGECGWAKYTGSPVAVIVACRAISAPQSQVSDRDLRGPADPMQQIRHLAQGVVDPEQAADQRRHPGQGPPLIGAQSAHSCAAGPRSNSATSRSSC